MGNTSEMGDQAPGATSPSLKLACPHCDGHVLADEEDYAAGYICPHCGESVEPCSAKRLEETTVQPQTPPAPAPPPEPHGTLPPVPGSELSAASSSEKLPPVPSAGLARSEPPQAAVGRNDQGSSLAAFIRAHPLLSVAAGIFAVIFGASFLLGLAGMISGGGAASPNYAITRVLEQSSEIARTATARYSGDAGTQAAFLAEELLRIDTSSCPADFRVAFQAHINAWWQAAPYFSSNTPLSLLFEALYSEYTGNFGGFGAASYNARLAAQNINQTYFQVTEIAAAYGARIPKSVVGR